MEYGFVARRPQGARSLKILHVITGLCVGGAENMLASLLADSSQVSEASVVSLIPGGARRGRLTEAGIPVLDLKMQRGQIGLIAILRLARIIGRHKPDIIQSWMYDADLVSTAALLLSGRRNRTRLIWGIRASNMVVSQYSLGLRITVRVCAWLSRVPDVIVANSQAGAELAALSPSEQTALGARERIETEFPKERAVREFQALDREPVATG